MKYKDIVAFSKNIIPASNTNLCKSNPRHGQYKDTRNGRLHTIRYNVRNGLMTETEAKLARELIMNRNKKRPAKKTDNPIITKLLNLKYRINDNAKEEGWSDDMSDHKTWIQTLINDVRTNNLTTIAIEDMQVCNRMWKLYA